jgi:hypothetical protein
MTALHTSSRRHLVGAGINLIGLALVLAHALPL